MGKITQAITTVFREKALNLLGIDNHKLSASYNFTDGSWTTAFPYNQNNPELYQEDYRSFAYSCINLRAEKIAESTTLLFKKQLKNEKPIYEHPFLELISKTNVYGQSFNEIEFLISTSLDLMGNALVYYPKNIFGMPTELIFVPWSRVVPMWNLDQTKILSYRYVQGTKSVEYFPDEVIHFRLPNLYFPLIGKATASACKIALNIDWYQSLSQSNFYRNDNRVGMVFTVPKESALNQEQRESMKFQLQEQNGGFRKSGNNLLLEGGTTASPYQATPKEADYVESRKSTRDEVCGVFRTPKSLLGFSEGVIRSQGENDLQNFIQNTIKPFSINFANPLNTFIKQNYDERLNLRIEFTYQESESMQIIRDKMELERGVTTINEYREKRGMEKSTEDICDQHVIQGKVASEDTSIKDSGSNNNNDNGNQ